MPSTKKKSTKRRSRTITFKGDAARVLFDEGGNGMRKALKRPAPPFDASTSRVVNFTSRVIARARRGSTSKSSWGRTTSSSWTGTTRAS